MKTLTRALAPAALACCLLAAAPADASAKDNWTRVRSKNFTLVGNAGEKDIRQVATRLEQFRDVFTRIFQGVRQDTYIPTTVVVFKSHDAYKNFAPPNTSGYFVGGEDVNYIALSAERRAENPYRIIFHEYVHLLVRNNMPPRTPAWVNEGLAEFYSTFEVNDERKVVIGGLIPGHLQTLRETKLIPLPTLFAVDHSSPFYNERDKRGIFYAQSWALVHYLLFGDGGRRKPLLDKYVTLLDAGRPAEEAYAQTFGPEAAAVEKELRDYLNRRRFTIQQATFERRLEFDRETQSEPLTEGQGQAYLGDLLLHAGQLERAEAHLQKALTLEPELVMAHASLGHLRVRQRRFPEARQHLERAVKSDTRNHLAHYYYALALLREQSDETGWVRGIPPQTAQTIRAHLRKSLEIAPEFAEPYDDLAFVSLITGEELEEAVGLMKRAMSLSPGRHDYALTLGQLHLRRRDHAAARRFFESVAQSTGADEQLRASARGLLETLGRNQKYEDEAKAAREREAASGAAAPSGARPGDEDAATAGEAPRLKRRGGEESAGRAEVAEEAGPPSIAKLKPRREGEEQARGMLTRVECARAGVIFYVQAAGNRTLRLRHADLQGLDIVTYTPDVRGEFTCGARNPPNHVFVTYRPAKGASAKTDGEIVAIDFVLADWK